VGAVGATELVADALRDDAGEVDTGAADVGIDVAIDVGDAVGTGESDGAGIAPPSLEQAASATSDVAAARDSAREALPTRWAVPITTSLATDFTMPRLDHTRARQSPSKSAGRKANSARQRSCPEHQRTNCWAATRTNRKLWTWPGREEPCARWLQSPSGSRRRGNATENGGAEMAWDFETDPEFEAKLAWMRTFVRDEIIPLEALADHWRSAEGRARFKQITDPLKDEVRRQGLWAAHLPPDMGGQGFGQVKLGLMHEILGACMYAPSVFGNNAPDSGNAELIAVGGTDAQREQWMQPLLEGKIRSSFSMTEPGAGADPTLLTTSAMRDGDEWVINGHKWFSSNASISDFLIVMVKTGDYEMPYKNYSMIIVPTNTPGVNILRDVPTMGEPDHKTGEPGGHAEILYENVRVPFDNIVGGEEGIGQGFALAQKRLGPGRIHHAMRWLGQSQRAFDLLCERALTRYTHGSLLAEKQMVQDWIAESYAEMQAARLLTLQAAWKMDQLHAAGKHYSDARVEIGVIKFWGAKVLYNVIDRAIQVHGSLGYTTDLPLESMYRAARAARIYDGPDEVHKVTVARQVLKRYRPSEPSIEHLPTRRAAALEKFSDYLDGFAVNE
jgi:acyl-CoA dehydrogenase